MRLLPLALLAVFGAPAAAQAPAVSPRQFGGEAPAMQGHAAESKMRDAEAELAHRRLFFDGAQAEAGEPGVSCDHRVATMPETSAGIGAVAIAWRRDSGRVVVRLWVAPGGDLSDAVISARLDRMARDAGGAEPGGLAVEVRRFAWCR